MSRIFTRVVRVSHGAVVQLQVGAEGALKDAMAKSIHIFLFLLLCVSRQHLLGETYKPSLLCRGAQRRTGRSWGSVCWLTTHWGILQSRSFFRRSERKKHVNEHIFT